MQQMEPRWQSPPARCWQQLRLFRTRCHRDWGINRTGGGANGSITVYTETQRKSAIMMHPPGLADPRAGQEPWLSEEEVIKNVMRRETVDGEFTTVQDV